MPSPAKKSGPINKKLIREHLRKVESSEAFLGSERHRKMLHYLVEETLAGRGNQIKGSIIARNICSNPESAIARVEKVRLQQRLAKYYYSEGRLDSIRIEISNRGFVLSFLPVSSPPSRIVVGPSHTIAVEQSKEIQARLLDCLQPVQYESELEYHLPRFCGREWVLEEVKTWLAGRSRIFWITGAAGVGKSALAAWLCDRMPEIKAFHYCRFGNSNLLDARKALSSIAYQLSTHLPEYRNRLNASDLERITSETNVSALVKKLLIDNLGGNFPVPDQPVVILIDALDEATENGKNDFAEVIGSDLLRTPAWLRFIVTSRPHETEINHALQVLDPWKLDAGRPENLDDIRAYLLRELRPLMGREPDSDVVEAIVEKSKGLFLYATWVREEIEEGRLSIDHVNDFPRGLGGIYAQFFNRYFPDEKEFAEAVRPVLEVICAAREPLRLEELSSLFSWTNYDKRDVLRKMGSLFPESGGCVRPFHQSVRDWLINETWAGLHWVSVADGHQRLTNHGWRQYQAGIVQMSRYFVVHLPAHLAASGRREDLRSLLLDFKWLQEKLEATDVFALLADFDFIASAESGIDGERMKESHLVIHDSIKLSAHVLFRDKEQLASQLYGRLLPWEGKEFVSLRESIKKSAANTWLRALAPSLTTHGSRLERTLEGHSGPVAAVAVTPDGKLAVSGSYDHTLKVWDLHSGRELLTLPGHSDRVNAVAVTPDGKRAISASGDRTLKVWNLESGRELYPLKGHSDEVHAVAVTSDGKLAISGSYDHTLKVWDLHSGRELLTLPGHSDGVTAVAVTPDGKWVISGSKEPTLKVWDLESGRELYFLEGHSEGVHAVAITPDGKLAISASVDGTLKLWDLEGRRELCSLKGHSSPVMAVAVTPDGKRIISGSLSRMLILWDLEGRREPYPIEGHSSIILAVAVTPDGKRAISASWDQTLKIWDLDTGREVLTREGHSDVVNAVAVTPDGKRAISASMDQTLKIWDLVAGRELLTLSEHSESVSAVAVTPDGKRAISASMDQTLKVWDLDTGREVLTLEGHSDWVNAVAVTPDGKCAISASMDQTLKIWDLDTGRKVLTLEGHSGGVLAVAVTPDGKRAISGSSDHTLKVWDLHSGRELLTLPGHSDEVNVVAVISDGKHVISASDDRTLKVWDLHSGRELYPLDGHSSPVKAVAVTPDGKLAISASEDRTLKVWDLHSGRELLTLRGHSDAVNAVTVTPDGKHVISASDDCTLQIWALDTGRVLAIFTAESKIRCCAIAGNGNTVVAGDVLGRVHMLVIEEPQPHRPIPDIVNR